MPATTPIPPDSGRLSMRLPRPLWIGVAIVILLAIRVVVLVVSPTYPGNLDERLIVACHRLDVPVLEAAIRAGADVNARFGTGDVMYFQDKWTTGYSAIDRTPLIALVNSSDYPDPPFYISCDFQSREWVIAQRDKIPRHRIEKRRRDRLTILEILLLHGCDVNAENGHGTTALFDVIQSEQEDVANVLLAHGARVNMKSGPGIDGVYDDTPLHRAYWSQELTKLLLEKGADAAAKDSEGRTPLDWARAHGASPDVLKLYESN